MELRKTKPFGLFDNHKGGVRHVHSNFDDRSTYENPALALHKPSHRQFFFLRVHTPMKQSDLDIGETFLHLFEPHGRVFQIQHLGLLDKRIHHIHLPALFYGGFDEIVDRCSIFLATDGRFYLFSATRQPFNNRYVEIAVDGHGEGAWNRSGRHYQQMGGVSFLHHLIALLHTKPMLLVDYSQAEFVKLHTLLNNGVRSDHDIAMSAADVCENILPQSFFLIATQESNAKTCVLQIGRQGLIMLFRKDLCRCHQDGLESGVYGHEHRPDGDNGLSGSHITLNKPVHLMPGKEILLNFPNG